MTSGIYLIQIAEIYYVGSAKDFQSRFDRHLKDLKENKHHNIILQRSFNKYGPESVSMRILETVPYEKKSIVEREQFHIDLYRMKHKSRCCNITEASFGDTKTHNPRRQEIIEKTSATLSRQMSMMSIEEKREKFGMLGERNGMYGKTHSNEVKQRLSEREYSEDTKKKMSESAIKKFKDRPDLRENLSNHASLRVGDKNPFYGRTHSEEVKQKMSEKNTGKVPANAMTIRVFGKQYSSFKEASEALGIPHTTIRWRCMSQNKKFDDYVILTIKLC